MGGGGSMDWICLIVKGGGLCDCCDKPSGSLVSYIVCVCVYVLYRMQDKITTQR